MLGSHGMFQAVRERMRSRTPSMQRGERQPRHGTATGHRAPGDQTPGPLLADRFARSSGFFGILLVIRACRGRPAVPAIAGTAGELLPSRKMQESRVTGIVIDEGKNAVRLSEERPGGVRPSG